MLWYLNLVLGSVYDDGRPVMSQKRLVCASEGAASMFVYVALGTFNMPLALRLFSNTSFDKFLEAWARFGWAVEPSVEAAGVEAPSEDKPDSLLTGVAAPLLSCVGIIDDSLRTASPRIVLMFLFRRWLGFHCALRKGRGME